MRVPRLPKDATKYKDMSNQGIKYETGKSIIFTPYVLIPPWQRNQKIETHNRMGQYYGVLGLRKIPFEMPVRKLGINVYTRNQASVLTAQGIRSFNLSTAREVKKDEKQRQ